MTDALWIIGPLAAVGLMYFAASRIDAHWVSKDGRRFLCQAQVLTAQGAVDGKAHELRIIVRPDGLLQLDQRRRMHRRITEVWRVTGKSADPPRRRAVYLLKPRHEDGAKGQIAVRLPDSSRAVAVLDGLLDAQRDRGSPPPR